MEAAGPGGAGQQNRNFLASEWATPTTIFKHCPVFNKPKTDEEKAAAKPSPIAEQIEATVLLQEENDRLKKELRDRFKPDDSACDIAVVLAESRR
jgi:hypothetical protein